MIANVSWPNVDGMIICRNDFSARLIRKGQITPFAILHYREKYFRTLKTLDAFIDRALGFDLRSDQLSGFDFKIFSNRGAGYRFYDTVVPCAVSSP